MILFPANCPLGQSYFYDSGVSGIPSLYYTYSGDAVDIAALYYELIHNDGDTPPVSKAATLSTPVNAAVSISVGYYIRTQNIASSVSLLQHRVVQVGSGVNGIVSANFETDFTFGSLDIYFRTYDGGGSLLDSVTIATGIAPPFTDIRTGTVLVTRADGATSVYSVWLDGVLVTTYDSGALSGTVVIEQEPRYELFFVGAICESRFTTPYYVGAGLPQICYGNGNDLFPNLVAGL